MALPVLEKEGKRVLLMGNEAIARGALEAGVEVASAYPGTPSSEVLETLWQVSKEKGFYAEWSTNEKVAIEVAAGASIAGARAICAMKNAGLNVAMDTFATLPYTGIRGGLVIIVADDPGAHYSSTEQDTRPLAAYVEIPCLEPSNQEEARDMTREAFGISESLEMPVMVRPVTRLSHASGDVALEALRERKPNHGFNKHYKIQYRWNVYGAPGAVSKHQWLHGVLKQAAALSETSPFNHLSLAPAGSNLGVIASGLGYSYLRDALNDKGLLDKVNLLKIGFVHPVPEKMVKELAKRSARVLVVEEGDPYLERAVAAILQGEDVQIYGRLGESAVLDPWGELNPDVVTKALDRVTREAGLQPGTETLCSAETGSKPGPSRSEIKAKIRDLVAPRSSTLCAGCPHLGSYWAVKKALGGMPGVHIVNGDIGCYEQGGYGLFGQNIEATSEVSKKYAVRTPYETLDTLYVMGSGLGMAQGQARVQGLTGKILAVSGDSTYFHAILPSLANAALTRADVTYLVLDNRWTAMTGHQPSPRTGANPLSERIPQIDIEAVTKSLGIQRVSRTSAFDLQAATKVVREAVSQPGPSVVILEGECALQVVRRKETKPAYSVVASECTGCRTCVQVGCPAVMFDARKKVAGIDKSQCTGCGICAEVCPKRAIVVPGHATGGDANGC